MKKLLGVGALAATVFLGLHGISSGHGGSYPGPGDTVPPGGGGVRPGGPGTGANGSGSPTPGPITGPQAPVGGLPGVGSNPPGATSGATTGTDGGASDLTVWQFWWRFNKDPYLDLKTAIYASGPRTGSDDYFLGGGEKKEGKDILRPSEQEIRETVVPALLQALEKERQNDVVTGCLIALAKIGDAKDEKGESAFERVISAYLPDANQEVSETAAVALGILASDASVPALVHLMKDDAPGRALVGRPEVDYRTRAFAAYGLGLIGARTEDAGVRAEIVRRLIETVRQPKMSTRDLHVAAVIALGLVPLDVAGGDAGEPDSADGVASRASQVRFLIEVFQDGRNQDLVRAHVPRALALLCQDVPELRGEVARVLLRAARESGGERNDVQQSCLLALGQLGDADSDPLDREIRDVLVAAIEAGGDQQARRFAAIALAQVGGRPGTDDAGYKDVKKELVSRLVRTGGGMSQLKPWLGLALGVLQRARIDRGLAPDREVGEVLRNALAECKTPADIGAYCIGVGISRDRTAEEIVLAKMRTHADDEARGYAAVALGLMGAHDAVEPIQEIVVSSKYRPDLLTQAAIGLGLLGDKELVTDLVSMLRQAKSLATQAAISSALGFIGDQRSIDPLVAMLGDREITATARGFAAVSLGIVADKESLPWNAKISVGIDYRASTTTLTGHNGTGILDIL